MSKAKTGDGLFNDDDEQALRQKLPHQLIRTNVTGVYAIPAPPDDFDAQMASAAELRKHGIYWPRPSEVAPRTAWDGIFARRLPAKDRIVPHLAPQRRRTRILGLPPRGEDDGPILTHNWAGAGLQGGPWTVVTGTWNIPTVSQPSEPAGLQGGWNSSSWVGIDGFILSSDVLQAGIEQMIDGAGHASYVAWFEWHAAPQAGSPPYIHQTNISNFPVSPGDQISCVVELIPAAAPNPALGKILLTNKTTSQDFNVLLVQPPGAAAQGNTVEWVMEAPDGGEPTSSLPKFTPVRFTSAVATDSNNTNVGNPVDGKTFIVETAANKKLTSIACGNEEVTIEFIG
ncbi:MAG TPA: G1 family glutamic endopeptidase [Acetobacteraceae bacterium]|nr:G1 family glutamic endopeptidase [Acetobacteraceae bacterium]